MNEQVDRYLNRSKGKNGLIDKVTERLIDIDGKTHGQSGKQVDG